MPRSEPCAGLQGLTQLRASAHAHEVEGGVARLHHMDRARLIVDGTNVMGSRPDGWWRDRAGAARRLVGRLQGLAATEDVDITVVFDGRGFPGLEAGAYDGVTVLYALRPGPDAADDRIVALVAEDGDPASLEVVTSDRGLAGRVAECGVTLHSAGALLGWLEWMEGG